MKRLFYTNKLRSIKHQTSVFILVSIVILISIIIFNLLLSNYIENRAKDSLQDKVLNIAKLVSHSEVVIEGLQDEDLDERIQDYSEEVRELTDVGFVVVLDMDLIRHSHPIEDEVGKSFFNRKDASDALEGKEYFSIEEGALGEGMRVFTPIYDESQSQIGVVCVGISMDTVKSEIQKGHKIILISALLQLIFGFLGAYLLSRRLKSILLDLEPIEIAQLVNEHQILLESVKEGIIVVNEDGRISLINHATLKLMQLEDDKDILGEPAENYMPVFNKVIQSGRPESDYEQQLYGKSLVVNCAPIIVNEKIIGAIATLRDKTELKLLYEELSGIRNYTETIRAQSHEFKNKLHVVCQH